jgi:hypothetical protein
VYQIRKFDRERNVTRGQYQRSGNDVRLTVLSSAMFSAAIYLGWFPFDGSDLQAPVALATGALITVSMVYGLAKG